MWVRVHIGDEIMKHTKGKWTASHISEFEFDIIDENGRTISTVTNWNEQEANASLIASAPELLDLARMERDKHIFGESKFIKKYGMKWNEIKKIRENLIAKAEGGV